VLTTNGPLQLSNHERDNMLVDNTAHKQVCHPSAWIAHLLVCCIVNKMRISGVMTRGVPSKRLDGTPACVLYCQQCCAASLSLTLLKIWTASMPKDAQPMVINLP
jgi:hypothetical protein